MTPPHGILQEESSPETVAIQPEASEDDQTTAISAEEEPIAAPAKQKRRLWPFIAAGVALLAVLGAAIFWLGWASGRDGMNDLPSPPPGEVVEMPGDHQGPIDEGAIPEAEDETIQQILILLAEGNRDRAGQVLRIAINRNPELWDILVTRVEQMAGNGNFEEAARLLGLALEARPDEDAEKFMWSGYLYFEAGISFEANLAFREALLRAPFMVEAHDQFVSSAIEADIVPEAITFLVDLSERFPDEYLIYSSLGDLYLYQGEDQMAIDAFEHALSLDPGNPMVLMSMANAYFYMDQIGEAVDKMNLALDAAPEDPLTLGQAGYLYLDLGDYAAALRVFEQAHELEMDNAWISLGYAEAVYYSGGDVGQVRELLISVEESARESQDIWLLTEVGWGFLDMDDCENAVRVFDFVEDIAPGETDAVDGIQECN